MIMSSQNYPRKKFIVAGFGNPLLDICVKINNITILDKFNLLPDGQKEVDEMELTAILNCLYRDKFDLSYCAGGSAQNTMRIIQHLVKIPSFTIFFGGCGQDKQYEILLAQVKESCIETRYSIQERKPTGTTISLINGHNRSIVAHLGAANIYTLDSFQSEDNIEIIKNVNFVYIEGFFISHSFEVALNVIKICRKHGNVVVFNLSGAYLFENYASEMATLASLADIVIGNRSEFTELGRFLNIQELSIKRILSVVKELDYRLYLPNSEEFIKKQPYKCDKMTELEKVIICTDGKDPVNIIYENLEFVTFDVPHLEPSLIKDTTGAGDAFAAGFIVGFMSKSSLRECLQLGCRTAQKVTQVVGCSFPDDY